MKKKILNQKGMTLLELVVAMAIFSIFVSLGVGAFVSLFRLQSQVDAIITTHQNGRILTEQITRLARQAESVTITHFSDPVSEDPDTELDPHNSQNDHGAGYFDSISFTADTETATFVPQNNLGYHSVQKDGFRLTGDEVDVKSFYFNRDPNNPLLLRITATLESRNSQAALNSLTEIKTSVKMDNLK